MKAEKAQPTGPESKIATGSGSQGPGSNNGLPRSSRKTFITSPRSPLAEKANCELRKLMTLKLSIYLGLSPLCEMPQKAPVSLSLSLKKDACSQKPYMPHLSISSRARPGIGTPKGTRGRRTSFLIIQTAFLNLPCGGESSPGFCSEA